MKLQTQHLPRRVRRGFTLLERVIVLGIIAMILGGSIYFLKDIGAGARVTQVRADFTAIDSSLRLYKLNAGSYPTTQQGLMALKEKPTTAPVPKMWSRL